MFKKIKIGSLIMFMALIYSHPTLAFKDVNSTDWYYPYLQELKEKKVFEEADFFNGDEEITRGEFVKIVVKTKANLKIKPTNSPSFKDVPIDSDLFEFIEMATQNGIVNGYRDASGNLTGLFGINDKINRAAATKILIETFKLPIKTSEGITFNDVQANAWYADYVNSAHLYGIVDGYSSTNFGPDDPITRAQLAKIAVLSQKKSEALNKEKPTDKDSQSKESPASLSVKNLTVSNPSSIVPLGATVELIRLELIAGSDNININEILVKRSGIGQSSDWSLVYARQDGKRASSGYSINQDTNLVKIPVKIELLANQKTTLSVYGQLNDNANPAGQHQFSVEGIEYIISEDQVESLKSISGENLSIGGVSTNQVTISAGSTPPTPFSGNITEVATFKIRAGIQSDITFKSIELQKNGSVNNEEVQNCELKKGNEKVAERVKPYENSIYFNLEKELIIAKNLETSFSVQCYLNSTAYLETIQLYLDETHDLQVVDRQFGFRAKVINKLTEADTPTITTK